MGTIKYCKRLQKEYPKFIFIKLFAESFRKDGKPSQRELITLGRRDRLEADETIDSLVESLAKFNQKYRVLKTRSLEARLANLCDLALIFGRLWEKQGLPEILRSRSERRKYGFDVERFAFAMALQRLCAAGSDLQGSGWVEMFEGLPKTALKKLYRTNGFLADVREDLEKALFARDRDLFSQELDLALTRGALPSCPNRITASVKRPEGAVEVSPDHSRIADRAEGPNESRKGRPAGFAVVETQQPSLWDRLPGSESSGAPVQQATATETEPDPAAAVVMEEVARKENFEQVPNKLFAERGFLTLSGYES